MPIVKKIYHVFKLDAHSSVCLLGRGIVLLTYHCSRLQSLELHWQELSTPRQKYFDDIPRRSGCAHVRDMHPLSVFFVLNRAGDQFVLDH